MDFKEFLLWEQSTHDTIDFKKIYVDVAGDLNAGLVLSEIVYWYLPSKKTGGTKLRVMKEGQTWIARRRYEWWERTRMSPKQADSALRKLQESGLIEKRTFKFMGEPTVHIRLMESHFLLRLYETLKNPIQNPFLPKGANHNSSNGESLLADSESSLYTTGETPYTENTSEITSEINNNNLNRVLLPPNLQDKFSGGEISLKAKAQMPKDKEALLDSAIGKAWNTNALGAIQEIKKTLLGLHPQESEYFTCDVVPPASVSEIEAFGDYYKRRNSGAMMPTKPHKIQDWMCKVQQLEEFYVLYHRAVVFFDVGIPPELADYEKNEEILKYLKRYYPEESNKLQQVFDYIDSLDEELNGHVYNSRVDYKGYEIPLPVLIPYDIYDGDFDANLRYIDEYHPTLADHVRATMNTIDLQGQT